jgi:transcriptional regulator with XRE-family HTH domain
MDAKKFGEFIAKTRKEKHMTQAELAAQLHVTDKAVSRWERDLGFPDINLIEPLSYALGLSVLEVMKSESAKSENITQNDVSQILSVAAEIAEQKKMSWKKWGRLLIVIEILITAAAFWVNHHPPLLSSLFLLTGVGVAGIAIYYYFHTSDASGRKIYLTFSILAIAISLIAVIHILPENFVFSHSNWFYLFVALFQILCLVLVTIRVVQKSDRLQVGRYISRLSLMVFCFFLILYSFYQNVSDPNEKKCSWLPLMAKF